ESRADLVGRRLRVVAALPQARARSGDLDAPSRDAGALWDANPSISLALGLDQRVVFCGLEHAGQARAAWTSPVCRLSKGWM
ncbi:MAG TPA: hypothetical protein VN306_02475, partial [Mycobacterium sp.]|nr:hypothetical protein [Mycobacterium sp.]